MGLGGPEVRLEEENATSESRVAMVARVARPRHRFGRPELEGEADSGGPLSATPEWRRGRAQRPHGPSAGGPACGPNSWATRGSSFAFLFLLMQNFGVCLNLNRKSCSDPKIVKLFG